jgi:hypothetical protein
MKKILIILTGLILLISDSYAQLWKLRRYEATGGIGTTQFFGDVGGYSNDRNILGIRDFTFRQTSFNLNAGLRYRITGDISVRGNIVSGIFHSTDSRGSNIKRGFESQTLFVEPSIIIEYYLIKNKKENSYIFLRGQKSFFSSVLKALDFYAFAGFGGLVYSVKPNSVLSPLASGTGGFTGVIPLGLGASMIYNEHYKFGIEIGGRFAFSDNIEGYTSPESQFNDVYHLLNFSLTYMIKSKKKG